LFENRQFAILLKTKSRITTIASRRANTSATHSATRLQVSSSRHSTFSWLTTTWKSGAFLRRRCSGWFRWSGPLVRSTMLVQSAYHSTAAGT